MNLSGKIAVVTGGARGIGDAIVTAFLKSGAKVAIVDKRILRDNLRDHILHEEEELFEIKGDVSQADQVRQSFEQIGSRWGRVDILVNCAGISDRLPLLDTGEGAWDHMMAVNLKGHFLCTQAAVNFMREQRSGSIINISSVRAQLGYSNDSCYIAAKGGVESFTRALAVELGADRIRVNCIAPGAIETDFNRSRLQDPVIRQMTLQSIPLGRIGIPEDVAEAALFLASDRAAFITGVTISVDGGQVIKG